MEFCFFAIGGIPEVWYFYNVVNNNVSNNKSGPCGAAAHLTYSHILLLNLPTLLDPKGRTMNGESILSASQIMVKHQGVKQQNQTNHGVGHNMVKQLLRKLWVFDNVIFTLIHADF
jgi:hypothetical protein